jgi:hypothetical protein
MSEVPDGRVASRAIERYVRSFTALMVLVAIGLFALGRWPAAIGVLLSPLAMTALSSHLRRAMRSPTYKNPRPAGMTIASFVIAMPGVVLVFVGFLVGSDGVVLFFTAIGASNVALAGLFLVTARALRAA